ncbi:MAG: hypothetical protein MNPFHGCM_01788 [Gemmatimonadaceae bacterium]|nr:hypothetical protein [Gemmatimonadaceae bacterium]
MDDDRSGEEQIDVGASRVSILVDTPDSPAFVYVLAHGAGAGMRHPFLSAIAARLVARGAATLRYQFPYMEALRHRVDSPDVACASVRAAVSAASRRFPGLPIVAGGKSFGGRMTSEAQSRSPLPDVRGLVFLGFPLHLPGKPGTTRAEHLARVRVPMLFLQGTRDEFASLDLLRGVVKSLGDGATLVLVDDGDHSFAVRKSAGRTAAQVFDALADGLMEWAMPLVVP